MTAALLVVALFSGAPSPLSGGCDTLERVGPSDAPLPDTIEILGRAEYDWALESLDGEAFTLERFRGRVLFLNFWATWCRPCVQELGSIARLAGSLEGTDVVFLLVSPEKADHVRSFLRRHGVDVPAAVEDRRMPPAFGLRAVPSTWVVDREGNIVLQHRGAAEWDRDEVRAFLVYLDDPEARVPRGGSGGSGGHAPPDPSALNPGAPAP